MNRSDYQLDVDISIVLFHVDNMVDITNKMLFSNNSILSPKVSLYIPDLRRWGVVLIVIINLKFIRQF